MKTQLKPLIPPLPKEVIKDNLSKITFLKKASRGPFEIYVFNGKSSPLLMKAVGRLRELTFRYTGGGTGQAIDIDDFDPFFDQLIIWNTNDQEIVGAYRIQLMKKLYVAYCYQENPVISLFDSEIRSIQKEDPNSPGFDKAILQSLKNFVTFKKRSFRIGRNLIHFLRQIPLLKERYPSNRFHFSPLATYFHLNGRFMKKYMPYSAELGRAFIQPDYQKSPFALEALFEGLGAWINKQNGGVLSHWKMPVTYLLGKITLYPTTFGNLDPIYYFMDMYFPTKHPDLIKPKGKYGCIRPYGPLPEDVVFEGDFKKDFTMIAKRFKAPVLIGQYGRLSSNMQCFGTILNKNFGNTEETAMMIKVPRIHLEFLERYHIKDESEESISTGVSNEIKE